MIQSWKPHEIAGFALFLFVTATYIFLAAKFPLAYIWATYEDLFGEWLQVYLFLGALLFSVKLSFLSSSYRWFYIVLSVACLYVILEEISWGQRLFGISSPQFFEKNNLQGEINLHNLVVGPYSTGLKAAIEYILAAGLLGYGLLYPLLIRLKWKLALFFQKLGVPAPPLNISAAFVVAAVLELGLFGFNEAEIAEILIGMVLMIMAIHYHFAITHGLAVMEADAWSRADSSALGIKVIVAFTVCAMLASLTVYAVYSNPRLKAGIESRIDNGVEKFAHRYKRYEQWEVSADLYKRVHEKRPGSASTLRHLARVYEKMGDTENFLKYINKALKLDLKRYQRKPNNVAVHQSLVHSYRLLGDSEKADSHLQRALRLASENTKKYPDSARAAYRLGKTYGLMGEYALAFEQFDKAYKLKPDSKRYRKWYYRSKIDLERNLR